MENLERLIKTCVELGAARQMELLGVTSGEISQRRALKTYGKWFADAVADHRLLPCRIDAGRNGTRSFRVVDILSLKAADSARAELQTLKTKCI